MLSFPPKPPNHFYKDVHAHATRHVRLSGTRSIRSTPDVLVRGLDCLFGTPRTRNGRSAATSERLGTRLDALNRDLIITSLAISSLPVAYVFLFFVRCQSVLLNPQIAAECERLILYIFSKLTLYEN